MNADVFVPKSIDAHHFDFHSVFVNHHTINIKSAIVYGAVTTYRNCYIVKVRCSYLIYSFRRCFRMLHYFHRCQS